MLKFTSVDGRHDTVCLIGKHDLKLPLLALLYISNASKWSRAGGDALFLRKFYQRRQWRAYTWFPYFLSARPWFRNRRTIDLVEKLIENVDRAGDFDVFVRCFSSGEIYLYINEYDENIERGRALLESGDLNI